MNPRPISFALLLCIALSGALVHAAEKDQPLYISADRVEIDEARGISSYLGRVELRQGRVTLQAARISVHRDGDALARLEASGTPVRFTQGKGDSQTRAEARHILYDLRGGEIRLSGGVHLWQGGNEFSGEQISYDIEKRLVKADRGDSGDGRIHAIIRPQKPAEKKEQP